MNDHYRCGSGNALVLIHGVAMSWRVWKPVLGTLAAERDVLAPQLAGHYQATPLPPNVAPTASAWADAVERQLDSAGFDAPDLVGNSLGGWIALELARRGRARTVVAISPAGGWSEAEGVQLRRYFLRSYAILRRLYQPALFLARLRCGRWALLRDFYARPGQLEPEEARYGLTALVRCPAFVDIFDANATPKGGLINAQGLEDVRCPVLIVFGGEDRITPPHQARYFLDRIADARLLELPGLGHVPMNDDPKRVARTILDFSGHAPQPPSIAGSTIKSRHAGRLATRNPQCQLRSICNAQTGGPRKGPTSAGFKNRRIT
jgi:pimeloyl-ACP methyl ester carboxylesterase